MLVLIYSLKKFDKLLSNELIVTKSNLYNP